RPRCPAHGGGASPRVARPWRTAVGNADVRNVGAALRRAGVAACAGAGAGAAFRTRLRGRTMDYIEAAKRAVKGIASPVLDFCGVYDTLIERRLFVQPSWVILMYHRVVASRAEDPH